MKSLFCQSTVLSVEHWISNMYEFRILFGFLFVRLTVDVSKFYHVTRIKVNIHPSCDVMGMEFAVISHAVSWAKLLSIKPQQVGMRLTCVTIHTLRFD